MRIQSLEQLRKLQEEQRQKTFQHTVLICGGTGCLSADSDKVARNFELILKAKGQGEQIKVIKTGCFGFCEQGPIVKIEPDNIFYVRVNPKDVKEIVEQHLLGGTIVERLLYLEPNSNQRLKRDHDMPFYKKQHRIALRNCGLINPEDIYEYIAEDGYQSLGQVLTEGSPEQVLQVIKESGLRGRGGGGFPTGLKWEISRASKGEQKYIICNADEGDPGAFMDRSILEGDPQSIIEAMAIAGYVIGANQGVIYIRAEYPLAIARLKKAITQARELGLLGDNIFGSNFSFDLSFKYGAGAFVCGEETALIRSCEGQRGEPTYKPPYPAQQGLWGHPTCVNNVETLANIPVILQKGASWYSSIGTEKSKGTKVFALAGKINNVGLVEVPMGITMREMIFEIGGGIKDGHGFKAVQTGGPSGGVITEKDLDTPIDYENLLAKGSMMGSGGMIVMDTTDNIVEIAKFYLEFTTDESCGRCTPCRIGTKRMHEMLCKITEGRAKKEDLELLEQLAYMVKDGSLCGLGQSAPNPVISSLKNFMHEYLAFIKEDTYATQ